MVFESHIKVTLLASVMLITEGCATAPSAPSAATVELTHVAFYPQTQDQCGPAALATVLHDAGYKRTLAQLEADVYLPMRRGSLQFEMLSGARRAGALAYVLPASMDALQQELAAGHPVVVLQNLRWDWLPLWHYAVVVGYDRVADTVILRSGDEPRSVMSTQAFEASWAKAQHWAFVALAPDRLPATATPDAYVQAAISLERVAPASAMLAYQTALAAWPDHTQAREAAARTTMALTRVAPHAEFARHR